MLYKHENCSSAICSYSLRSLNTCIKVKNNSLNSMLHGYWLLETPLNVFINIFQIIDATRVCSAHLHLSEYKKTLAGNRMISATAVPSLFAWTKDPLLSV